MTKLIYTFRTFRQRQELGENAFVFGPLRQDLKRFLALVQSERPSHILGVGNGESTGYETRAINQFHGRNLITGGPEFYTLYVPKTDFKLSHQPTQSFCNWTMYRIMMAIQGSNIQLSFLHVAKSELEVLGKEIKNYA